MRRFVTALAGLGMLGVSGIALAQGGPPPGFVPPPPVPAPLWGTADFVQTNPVIFADLGAQGPAAFSGTINSQTNQLCYIISTPGKDDATAAHIHTGGADETGAPVVTLKAPVGGASGGCETLKPDLAAALLANPNGYYVNVHTKAFPAGEERGQLATKGRGQR